MDRIVRMAGRHAIAAPLASGGAASIHLAVRAGSTSVEAIKRLHPHLASDPETRSTLLDEARLASRVRHPNVVPILEVVEDAGDVLLVMEYVHGESFARLMKEALRREEKIPWSIVSAIIVAVLDGLHAAHEATNERGEPLHIVHRDVSPQNILVGADGRVRLIDFGVAKAKGRLNTTRDGSIKGKLAYMAPEHLKGMPVTRRVDIYGASVVLWEGLTGKRLFVGDSEGELLMRVFEANVEPPSHWSVDAHLSQMTFPNTTFRQLEALDALTLRGLAHDPEARFTTAHEMARELEASVAPAPPAEVAAWLAGLAGPELEARAAKVAALLRDAQEPAAAAPVPEAASLSPSPSPPSPPSPSPSPSPPVPRERDEREKKRWLVPVLGAVALVGACIGAFRFAHARDLTVVEGAAPPPETSSIASAPTNDVPSARAPEVTTGEAVTPPDAGLALDPVPPPPRAAAPVPRIKSAPGRRAIGGKPSGECDPPYIRDPSGIILHKPQCIAD